MNLDLLKTFCGTDETRPSLMEPFSDDRYTYATDGRIIVRVPRIESITGHEKHPQYACDLFPDESHYLPVEYPQGLESFVAEPVDCECCGGTGKQSKCRDCDGDGNKECPECGTVHKCESCRGTGLIIGNRAIGDEVDCEDCEGIGKIEKRFIVSLNRGAVFVDLKYIKLANTLPGLWLKYDGNQSPLYFTFAGGDGVMMPLVSQSETDNMAAATKSQWMDENSVAALSATFDSADDGIEDGRNYNTEAEREEMLDERDRANERAKDYKPYHAD